MTQRKSNLTPNGTEGQGVLGRRAMLGTAGLAATAALLGPVARVAKAKDAVVPAPVYFPTFRQMLELVSPPPSVMAVIPRGPDSTDEAATLSLFLATRQKEELQFGAMTWAVGDGA